jgi:hypothetical protein
MLASQFRPNHSRGRVSHAARRQRDGTLAGQTRTGPARPPRAEMCRRSRPGQFAARQTSWPRFWYAPSRPGPHQPRGYGLRGRHAKPPESPPPYVDAELVHPRSVSLFRRSFHEFSWPCDRWSRETAGSQQGIADLCFWPETVHSLVIALPCESWRSASTRRQQPERARLSDTQHSDDTQFVECYTKGSGAILQWQSNQWRSNSSQIMCIKRLAPLAQLDRASVYGTEG